MKLISLELQNFRQHIGTSIAFLDGVTGIVGPNGSGKTTILEAIAWALYGAPAVRGTNDTIRSKASEGGAKVNVGLAFELSGQQYRVSRTLDGSGRSGSAALEVDGRPLRSGMSEVSEAIAKLLGMDYRAFFTSFFTGQKQLEFMSQLEGRARAAAIGRMLGYDRITKARDQANEDRKMLHREIEGLEKGLGDPEEINERKKNAREKLAAANAALAESEKSHAGAEKIVEELKPVKEASDQKARRFDEITRRLEIDRMDLSRAEARLSQLQSELVDLDAKRKDLDSLQESLAKYEHAREEYRRMADLQKHESERQRLSGQIAGIETETKRLEARDRQLAGAPDAQTRITAELAESERILADAEDKLRTCREQKVAREHGSQAQTKQFEWQLSEVEAKRAQIAKAGQNGMCPTCERPLSDELPTVLANFDAQIDRIKSQIKETQLDYKRTVDADTASVNAHQADRDKVAAQVDQIRAEKAKVDALVMERDSVKEQLASRNSEYAELHTQIEKLPCGFDQAKFMELRKVGEELQPVYKRAIELKSALERRPAVVSELGELTTAAEVRKNEVGAAEQALSELEFSAEEREKLLRDFDAASTALSTARVLLERQRGEVNMATAILSAAEREEENFKSKMEQLKEKRTERLHLQTVAEALDKLRAELNDRIKPELESLTGELLSTMTDGRYNVVGVDDNYQATIIDDNERKPVISGGEDDVLNLALRLAVSQMIADRAGQSFSLLILDEVFGSLDETRRDNVVALLQNLKNRFEQIILITHIESIHDAVDNCLWVDFDEKTKTSRLIDRSEQFAESMAGAL